jgi:histidinol-phosphatase (PHP family)
LNLIDCHTHTNISPDADKRATVEMYCKKAKTWDLKALAVTEHLEVNRYQEEKDNFEKSMSVNTNSKKNYPFLISGLELGQATQDFETAEKILSDNRLDFVIGSIHELPGREDFAFINYHNVNVKTLLKENFLEILKLCKWGKFDVLGHLTYVLRYMSKAGVTADLQPYNDIIAECFRELIDKGKGIEINTSGLRQNYGKTFPSLKYIKLFKDLGGDVISVGSDAHRSFDLCSGVKEGAELALEAGFRYFTVFRERKPIKISIEG